MDLFPPQTKSSQFLAILRRYLIPIVGALVAFSVFILCIVATKNSKFYNEKSEFVPYWQVVFVMGGLIMMVYFMVLEPAGIPPYLVMLFGCAIWSLLGIIPSEKVLAGLSNGTVTTVGLLFIAAKIVVNTGVLDVAIGMLLGSPASRISASLRVNAVVGLFSGVFNNTPMIALMRPILQNWCMRTGFALRDLAMPMAFASQLGGSLTMMGSPTNFASKFVFAKLGWNFGFFELTVPAMLLFGMGVAYFALFAHLFPGKIGSKHEDTGSVVYSNTFQIAFKVDIYGAFNGGKLSLVTGGCCRHTGVNGVIMVIRDLTHLVYTRNSCLDSCGEDEVKLVAGDVVVFDSTAEGIVALRRTRGLTMSTEEESTLLGLTRRKLRCVYEIELPTFSGLLNREIATTALRQEHNCALLAVRSRDWTRLTNDNSFAPQVVDDTVSEYNRGRGGTEDRDRAISGSDDPWSRQLARHGTRDLAQNPLPGPEDTQLSRQSRNRTRTDESLQSASPGIVWIGNHVRVIAQEEPEQNGVQVDNISIHINESLSGHSTEDEANEDLECCVTNARWKNGSMKLPDGMADTVAVASFDGFYLAEGDVLLVEADPREIGSEAWTRDFGIIRAIPNSSPPPPRVNDTRKKVITALILLGLVIAVVLFVLSSMLDPLKGFTLTNNLIVFLGVMVASEVMPVDDGLRTIDIGVLLTMVGAFPLGDGLSAVGLDTWFANTLLSAAAPAGPYWIMIAMYVVSCGLSNLIANVAVITIVAPIAVHISAVQQLTARSCMLATVLGTSAVFSCPIGHQTNLMVVPLSNYTWGDFFKCGGAFQLVHMLVTCFLVMYL